MMFIQTVSERLAALIDLGGPVIAILLCLSIVVLAAVLFKFWQFWILGVGRHRSIDLALDAWDRGNRNAALGALESSKNHVAPILAGAIDADAALHTRLTAMAESQLSRVERGFRLFDSIAQIAPLLGLFGTVVGMIDAFRALQTAGSAVGPSILAGGIWVALLTTAAGLAVAMPTTLALTFFESRAARERSKIDLALETLFHPMPGFEQQSQARMEPSGTLAHVG